MFTPRSQEDASLEELPRPRIPVSPLLVPQEASPEVVVKNERMDGYGRVAHYVKPIHPEEAFDRVVN